MNAALKSLHGRDVLLPILIGMTAAAAALLLPSMAWPAALLLLAAPLTMFVLLDAQRWLALFFIAALLLPPLPIAIGNSGPHVAALVAALGIPVGLLRLGEWRFRGNLLPASLALFFLVLLASVSSALFHSGWTIGAGSLARVLLFGIACFVFFYSAYGPRCDARHITRVLIIAAAGSALFACLDFHYQWPAPAGFGPQFIWLDSGIFRRAQGFFYEASTLGNVCAFFLTGATLCAILPRQESPVSRLVLVLSAPLFAIALLLSYSRASLVNLGVSLAILLCLHHKRLRARHWLRAAILLVGVGSLAAVLLREFVAAWLLRLWLSAQYFFSAADSVLSGRLESWSRLGQFLAEHPWALLFGVGYKTLPYSDFPGGPITVDNMYLSLLAETGIIGLAAFLLLNAAILGAAWRARRTFFGAWILCFWAGQLCQMLSGDLLTYWRVMPIYFWVLGQAVREEMG